MEKDDAAHRFVVDAKGKDKRGNGTAGAKVTLSMAPTAAGGTDVEVLTDLAVTGKPAQFGRGVMQDVSDKLLGQFVACLEQRLGDAGTRADGPTCPRDPAARHRRRPGRRRGRAGTRPTRPRRSPAAAAAPASPPPARADDAINLGSTVLPILLRTYWKQGLAALVVIALIVILIVVADRAASVDR